MHSDSVVTY